MNKVLMECGLRKNVVDNMKAGSMPSADKLAIIAKYLEVSTDYLLGLTDDPTPPKKELTAQDKLNIELAKLTPEKRKQAEQFIEFLKIQEEFGQELSAAMNTFLRKPQPELSN